ncbi:MAG TPA: hypothetical protein P5158_06780 [Chitinophagaceae bacterium]|jgi:signal transduction histidine kinase|nr:hypothetical protein [Chitinophagaceae bacterium]
MIIQPAFEISEEAFAGLVSGELIRYGGVIYRKSGGIFEHLKDVSLPEQSSGILEKVVNAVKKPKNIVLIGLGVVIMGGIVYFTGKNRKRKAIDVSEMPTCVENYNNALCDYLEAIHNSALNLDTINTLILALDDIKENFDSSRINIDFSAEQFDMLVNLVFDYTQKLAEANSIKYNEQKEPVLAFADNAVIGLRRYLEVQKQIFENAA